MPGRKIPLPLTSMPQEAAKGHTSSPAFSHLTLSVPWNSSFHRGPLRSLYLSA